MSPKDSDNSYSLAAHRRSATLTTKTSPSPFSKVHLTLNPSLSSPCSSPLETMALFSMITSRTSELTGERDVDSRLRNVGLKDRDQRISPPMRNCLMVSKIGRRSLGGTDFHAR